LHTSKCVYHKCRCRENQTFSSAFSALYYIVFRALIHRLMPVQNKQCLASYLLHLKLIKCNQSNVSCFKQTLERSSQMKRWLHNRQVWKTIRLVPWCRQHPHKAGLLSSKTSC